VPNWDINPTNPSARDVHDLHPQVGARQNAFCERQDAFYVGFFELTCSKRNASSKRFSLS
jgi:hypothetical protein